MVKVEDSYDSDGPLHDHLPNGDVGSSGSKPPSAPISVKQETLPSSSSGHLKSYFTGMGFSSDLVDRAFEENGDDENLILEALFRYSKSSPNALDSLDGFSSSDMEEENSPIEFASEEKQEIKETIGPLNDDLDKRSYLATMNFSEEEIDSAVTRLAKSLASSQKERVTRGENAPLPELVDFIVTAQTIGCSGDEANGSANGDHEKNEVMSKSRALLQMGFTENEVSSAIDNFGPEAPIDELADSIFANRLAHRVEKEEDFSVDFDNFTPQNKNGLGCRDYEMDEYPKGSHYVKDPWISKTSNSNSDPWTSKSSNITTDPWISKASSSNASPYSYKDATGVNKVKLNDSWSSKASSSSASPCDYEDVKVAKKAKHVYGKDKTSPLSSNYIDVTAQDDWESDFETKPNINSGEAMPGPRIPNLSRNANGLLSKHPYFFYGNVVDVSQQTWRKLSQFLYGIEPEHVNCQFFSAFIRKEGYMHNLPTEGRFHIVPKPPMTLEEALPHTKKCWPSWDARKQLGCISSGTTGVDLLCDRLGKVMRDSRGLPSREDQVDILHQCRRLNLIWVGQYKLSPIEPDQVERILGYPRHHTDIWGQTSDRLEVLKHSFQTDTIGYHLSVLKSMCPNGLRVLSIFSGIGGAEVALHRLGIRLRCVVSVEESEINRKILKRWWINSGQTGVLKQIGGIEKFSGQMLESFMDEFGGFDFIIAGNPTDIGRGCSRDGSMELDLNPFFEFVRIFQRVRSMARNT